MKLKNEELWAKSVANNQDPYGKAGHNFAERWADLMEIEIAAGKKFEDFATATSRVADSEGITGFLYGCAVALLSQVWEHGDDLRRWHNLDCQIGTEGERANENGGVLNPALLCVK